MKAPFPLSTCLVGLAHISCGASSAGSSLNATQGFPSAAISSVFLNPGYFGCMNISSRPFVNSASPA